VRQEEEGQEVRSGGTVRGLGVVACVAGWLIAAGPAAAATITPDVLTDEYTTVGDSCSLREAIQSANNNADFGDCDATGPGYSVDDRVVLDPGTYQLSIPGQIGTGVGDLETVTGSTLTIANAGAGPVTIDGGDEDRVLYNADGATLTLVGLTIRNGEVVVGGGGGLFNSGDLTIRNSTITDNQSQAGGGIAATSTTSPVTLENVTISGNRSSGFGGGISLAANAPLTANNVTITGNAADTDGTGADEGGGLSVFSDGVALANTIVAGNTEFSGGSPDCYSPWSPIASLGFNLIGSTAGCSLTSSSGDLTNLGPQLGPLADNGGTTFTHALLAGSPAIDAGNPAAPGSSATACAGADQRGTTRPQGSRCDIGAFELVPAPPPTTTAAKCAGLKKKARKRCLCKQKKGKKRKKCLKKLKKGRKA
jgi:CSLREA domain-containing protein